MNYLNNLFDKHLTNLFDHSYPMLARAKAGPQDKQVITLYGPHTSISTVATMIRRFTKISGPLISPGPSYFAPSAPPPSRRPYRSYLMGNLMCYLIILNLHVKYFSHVFLINASLFIKQE